MSEKSVLDEATRLSEMFVSVRGENEIRASEEDLRVTLPFFLLNSQKLNLLPDKIYRTPGVIFRLNSMRELFECTSIPKIPDTMSFEDCTTTAQRLFFLSEDLELLNAGQPAKAMNMHQYQQFMSDSLVILYARFGREVPLSAFIAAAFSIGDTAVLALAFTFPHFICPLFKAALNLESKPELLVTLAAICPAHRPLFLSEIKRYPMFFALFAIRYFPEEAPMMITSLGANGLGGLRSELLSIKRKTQQFYLCYARCCASSGDITEQDYHVLEHCTDDQLLIHLMFAVDDSRYIGSFADRFLKKTESMTLVLELISDVRESNTNDVAEKIAKVLGDDIEWTPKTAFASHVMKNLWDVINIDPRWFGKGNTGLHLIDAYRDDLSLAKITEVLPVVINGAEYVDFASITYIDHFVQLVSRQFCDKVYDLPGFARTIEGVLNKSGNSFDLSFIATNCCPAVLYLELLLFEEERIAALTRQDQSYPRFLMANKLPIRFVVNCAFHNPNCAKIFGQLCGKCQMVLPYLFCQSPLIGQKTEYLLSDKDPAGFLSNLPRRVQELGYDAFTIWMKHRFVMPFQYVIDTIAALEGPVEFLQLQDAFSFPTEVLHNAVCLKIICVCLLDILALYQELFPVSEVKVKTNASLFLFLQRAIDLLKDPLIDAKEVCAFINDIFFTANRCIWLLDPLLQLGVDDSLIPILTRNVNALAKDPLSWNRMIDISSNKATSTKTRLFLLVFASYAAEVSPSQEAYDVCFRMLSATREIQSITEENVDKVLASVVRIARVFPDLAGLADSVLERFRALVLDFPSKPHLLSSVDMAIEDIAKQSFTTK